VIFRVCPQQFVGSRHFHFVPYKAAPRQNPTTFFLAKRAGTLNFNITAQRALLTARSPRMSLS